MTELTQEEKLALRLKQAFSVPGLHTIQVYVTPDLVWQCWFVDFKKPEGLPKVVYNAERQ